MCAKYLQKIWIFNFPRQCNNMPKVRWEMLYGFRSKFLMLTAVQKFWKSVKISQSDREFKSGKFFETQCRITINIKFTTKNIAVKHSNFSEMISLHHLTKLRKYIC